MGGVSRGAITLACRPGGALHEATLDRGRVDSGHRVFKAWLARRADADFEAELAWRGAKSLDPAQYPTLQEFADLAGVTLEQLEADIAAGLLGNAVVEILDGNAPSARRFLLKAWGR